MCAYLRALRQPFHLVTQNTANLSAFPPECNLDISRRTCCYKRESVISFVTYVPDLL